MKDECMCGSCSRKQNDKKNSPKGLGESMAGVVGSVVGGLISGGGKSGKPAAGSNQQGPRTMSGVQGGQLGALRDRSRKIKLEKFDEIDSPKGLSFGGGMSIGGTYSGSQQNDIEAPAPLKRAKTDTKLSLDDIRKGRRKIQLTALAVKK